MQLSMIRMTTGIMMPTMKKMNRITVIMGFQPTRPMGVDRPPLPPTVA